MCAVVLQLETLVQERQEAAQAANEDYSSKVRPAGACSYLHSCSLYMWAMSR